MASAQTIKHPAAYSLPVICSLSKLVNPDWLALDPFAGIGRVHMLPCRTIGVEIEPEWASVITGNIVGNALRLPFADHTFDLIVVSPCYGNRMADSHDAKDDSVRYTYTHQLGRKLHPQNSGQLQWGSRYKSFHFDAWKEVCRTLKLEGTFLLNCSDHIRNGKIQRVTNWHVDILKDFGLTEVKRIYIRTPRMRNGANRNVRVGFETISVLKRSSLGSYVP